MAMRTTPVQARKAAVEKPARRRSTTRMPDRQWILRIESASHKEDAGANGAGLGRAVPLSLIQPAQRRARLGRQCCFQRARVALRAATVRLVSVGLGLPAFPGCRRVL